MHTISSATLIEFESKIANLFNQGKIPHPIHLSRGNEDFLIKIFNDIKPNDWVFSTWRSHYHCLLKGVPEYLIEQSIVVGKSIALNFPKYKFFSSAIVGGQLSQAVGVAMSIKRRNQSEKVWCFLGDMTSETGIAQSCFTYSQNFDLPITFVIEDNNQSVMTNTREVWGSDLLRYEELPNKKVISYKYSNLFPHAGAGKRVEF